MAEEKLHFNLSFAILVVGMFSLLMLFLAGPQDDSITAYSIADMPRCDDGTKLGECSHSSIGNSCQMSRQGPRLEFEERCYEFE